MHGTPYHADDILLQQTREGHTTVLFREYPIKLHPKVRRLKDKLLLSAYELEQRLYLCQLLRDYQASHRALASEFLPPSMKLKALMANLNSNMLLAKLHDTLVECHSP
jgi:hypothetical protein